MNLYMRLVLLLFVLLSGCTNSGDVTLTVSPEKSDNPDEFSLGKIISGDLLTGDEDRYELELEEGYFVYGYANQISVDLIVSIIDPDGKQIANFDGPASGPENFNFTTEKSGIYVVKITPFEENEGQYAVVVVRNEPVASTPEGRVDQLMAPYSGENVPGGVIGVVRDGKLAFVKSYGSANLSHGIPFSDDTPTNIGSVSKQFTAFAILLLEQQGKLSLEDDIREHMPEFPDFGETITIKNLLNHTNGLREIYNIMPMTGWRGEDGLLRDEAMKIVQRQPELQASPGEVFNYNNTAFILAATLVERLTDQTFPDWMKENVFDPLEMKNTYVRSAPDEIIPGASMGYSNGDNGFIESGDLHAAYGAGGIYTTPADFARWLNNFKDPQLGGKELIEKLTTPGILNDGDTLSYALGIGVGEFKGLKRVLHGGADIAHRAALHYYPEIDAGVIALSNNASFTSGGIANQVAEAFFYDDMEQEEVEVEPVDDGEYDIDPELLEEYEGKYKSEEIGLIIEYTNTDGLFEAQATGQPKITMKAKSDTNFSYEGVEAEVVFERDGDGKVTGATHTQGGSDLKLIKLPPYDPSPEDLKRFEGRYFSEEVETFYTIVLKEDKLVVELRNWDDIELSPTEENTFSGNQFFIGELKFIMENGGPVSFTVSNGRTKGILFEKQ